MDIFKIFTVFSILSNKKKATNLLSFYCTAKAETYTI